MLVDKGLIRGDGGKGGCIYRGREQKRGSIFINVKTSSICLKIEYLSIEIECQNWLVLAPKMKITYAANSNCLIRC